MRTWTCIASILILAALAGCNNDAKIQAKRDQDRMEIQLEQAQNDRDADKAEIDQLKAQLSAANDQNAKLTQQVSDLQQQAAAHPPATEPAK
jgi:septal ring factor EnvC (AmiA/AmiB activator)